MFTGIVEEMGVVKTFEPTLTGARLSILAETIMDDLPIGASVSVNGACLTVITTGDHEFTVDVSPETLAVTTFGKLAAGVPVNLERAMKLNERIGGHMVAGHVDGVGWIREKRQDGNALVVTIEAPPDILRYCVPKGSVTIDGVSMTLNSVSVHTFSVAVDPPHSQVRRWASRMWEIQSTWNPT